MTIRGARGARFYDKAGRPSLRELSEWIKDDDSLPATASHEQVRKILSGKPATWKQTRSLVQVLARESQRRVDLQATVLGIQELWLAADGSAAKSVVLADSELDVAVRGVYGDGPKHAITAFLRASVHVPVTDEGGFVLAETQTRGRWLCVFTSKERLAAHEAATEQTWPVSWALWHGHDLVQQLHAGAADAGILVDVWTRRYTLPITAAIITEMVR